MVEKFVETGGIPSETDKMNVREVNAIDFSKRNPQDIFYDATKAWRKQINHVQGQLVSCTKLRHYKTIVVSWKMYKISTAHEQNYARC